MARAPRKEAKYSGRPKPWAEFWLDATDVAEAITAGLKGNALVEHLGRVAGGRYVLARRHRTTYVSSRADTSITRPAIDSVAEPSQAVLEVEAWKHWLWTRRCPFMDKQAFLVDIEGWT